jgi:glucose-6-phosphate dehydrogenase assembly protein OpcA
MPAVSDHVWSAEDTTPDAIEAALRRLLAERHAENASYVPARVLNLICIVDREWSGEIANRLRGVGRYHPSRTVVCAVERGRKRLGAIANVASDVEPQSGQFALTRESVVVYVGPEHVPHLGSVIDPLVVTDLPTVIWSPHGHPEAVDAVLYLAQVVLLDSVDEPVLRDALRRARELCERGAYVVDLAWLRSTPWRERVAAAFDPPSTRTQLKQISALRIRHHPDSGVAGLLLAGWMASRLGWRASELTGHPSGLTGQVRAARGEVRLALESTPQPVPGLVGLTLETAAGAQISLDRGPGGLRTVRRGPDGHEHRWTLLGASRGESGILGEGIRQALLRDPTYRPSLDVACAMAP